MQAERYNQWDFNPLNLRPDQVENPLSVINTFFDNDAAPGHLNTLRDWCFTILKHDFYRNEKGSPSGLLYFHKVTISLIEAVHLLKDMAVKPDVSVTDETLSFEQREWSYYPVSLTKEQQLNPYQFLDAFFGKYNLPQYREHLYDWLEYGLSIKPAGEYIEAEDLLTVNENLQKLFDAAWLIFQRTSAEQSLKRDATEGRVLFSHSSNLSSAEREALPVSIYQLDSGLQGKQSTLISSVVSIIVHKISSVKAIIYLGATANNKLYLLVLTDNEEQRQAQGLAGMIEDSCKETANVVALVHHSSALLTGLKRGNRFINNALSCPPVYLSGDLLLPPALPLTDPINNNSLNQWEHWYKLATDFWNGAQFHLKQEADNAALFCLHQSAECVLVALVRAVLNYDINNHNLSRLLAIIEMFTTDITAVFGLDYQIYRSLFDVLKHAYVNVRYKDGYEANHSDVVMLSGNVKALLGAAKRVYERHKPTSDL